MPDTIQVNEQDRIIGELRFTDEWAGTRVERTDSKYGNDRVYAIDGLGEYTSVTSSLNIINKPRLADWRKNRALDKVELLLSQPAQRSKYKAVADEKNARAKKHNANNPKVRWNDSHTWHSFMREDAKKAPGEIMEASRVFGNESHELIELALLSGDVHVDPAYAHIYEGFTAWQRDTGLTVVATELMVWHSFHEYAGTIDMVIRTDSGALGVIDIKTGGVFNEAAMQLAAYAKALRHLTGEQVEHAWVLQLPRERSKADATEELYQFVKLADLPHWFDGFKAAKELAPYSEEEAWPQLTQTS